MRAFCTSMSCRSDEADRGAAGFTASSQPRPARVRQRKAPPKPAEKPLQAAEWNELTGWTDDDPSAAFAAFVASCRSLERQAHWKPVCASARDLSDTTTGALRAWFEGNFRPWALVNPDGSRNGLITGYYEPILKGSRQRGKTYQFPVFGPPEDLIVVELAELYPELKHLRLRGRLEGRKLIPYYSRAEWGPQESKRSPEALLFIDDAIDLFFMQIQGSGQIQLADGSRVRLNYADQNGHPLPLDRALAGGSGRDESRAGVDAEHQGLGQGQPEAPERDAQRQPEPGLLPRTAGGGQRAARRDGS
jgi:membrane-bound lytic murein transglycosylase